MSESNGAKGGVVSDVRIYKTLPVVESLNPLKGQKVSVSFIDTRLTSLTSTAIDRTHPATSQCGP
jgi:hypothetical protein